jgi:putative peptidoglycan lipid II flippase
MNGSTRLPTSGEETAAHHRRMLVRSTAFFSAATALSRVLGLVREMVTAYLFGVQGKINAFTVAFQIPNLVRALVADAALSGAFVPVFSELLVKGERARAWRVASTVFWLVLLGLSGLTALFVVAAPLLLRPFGDPGGDFELAVGLSRVLFPIVVLLGLSGIVVAILNSYEKFVVPALTPVLWNVAIVVGLAIGVPAADGEDAELYVYAFSILVATLLQFLMPLPWLRGLDGRLRPVVDWRDPAVKRFFALMLPVTLTLGLINVNALIGILFASRLIDPDLAPAAIDKAFRLYMLPQGVFAVAVTTVLFPTLSRLAARGDRDGFGRTVDGGLRLIAFLLVPAGLMTVVLAEPIVRLVYERGAFDGDQTQVVAFYSLQTSWVPTAVALGNVALNVVLYASLYRVGVWGIPLGVSIANLVGAGALYVLLRRRVENLALGGLAVAIGRILAASVIAAAVGYAAWRLVDAAAGRTAGGQVVAVGVAFALSGVAYAGVCRALRVRELETVASLRRDRSG